MGATLATASAISKEIYQGTLQEQLNNATPLLSRIDKTSEGVESKVGGRYVVFPIHTRRNQGIGARNELEQLPTPGQQGTASARVGLAYLYGGVQLSGQTLKLIDKDYQAFTSAFDLEVEGLRADLKLDLARQLYGDGKGTIGKVTVASATAVSTISVDRPDLFQLGEIVDYVLAADNTVSQAARTITAIDLANKTVTVSGAAIATTAVGDYFVRTGNLNREWVGLSAIVANSGTIYNIDPTVEPVWKSTVNTNGGTSTAVSEGMFTKMSDDIYTTMGEVPTVIAMSLGVRRAYVNLLRSQRQFVNTKEYAGGFSGIAFATDNGEIPMFSDFMAPSGTSWFLNEKKLKIYRESDWEWLTYNDSDVWQQVPGYDAFSSTLVQYSQLGTRQRNAHGLITNITEE